MTHMQIALFSPFFKTARFASKCILLCIGLMQAVGMCGAFFFFFLLVRLFYTGHATQVHANVHESFQPSAFWKVVHFTSCKYTRMVCTSFHAITAADYENGCVYSYVVNLCCPWLRF